MLVTVSIRHTIASNQVIGMSGAHSRPGTAVHEAALADYARVR